MFSRIGPSVARVVLLMIGVYTLSYSAVPPAYALDLVECTMPMKSCLCMAGDESCATRAELTTPRQAAVAREQPEYKDGIPNETLSLYKTISYVTGATLMD